MSGPHVKACLRCHSKKIKCTGYPECLGCTHAKVQCEVYVRPRRNESPQLREAHRRISWLQTEINRKWGLDCASLPTGTRLQFPSSQQRDDQILPRSDSVQTMSNGSVCEAPTPSEDIVVDHASEASLLALNASGELKYLGASSGAFFASCAAALIRSSTTLHQTRPQARPEETRSAPPASMSASVIPTSLKQDHIHLLLKSYEMWVHPLYPLFDLDTLQGLVARHSDHLMNDRPGSNLLTLKQRLELTIVHIVMALGAMNLSNTLKQLHLDHPLLDQVGMASSPSPASLCATALKYLESCLENSLASIECIQVLLLFCIYSSYGPVGASQWQLAGMATRMAIELGLHHDQKRWYASELQVENRRRVFWTAYVIEVTLAYNLGRPPSISHEHITTKLPNEVDNMQLGVLHIKHRQIQGKIMSRMYQVSSREDVTWDEQQRLIAELQADLDQWRLSIPAANGNGISSAYPLPYWHRLYHSTTFVLHRKGPLCPLPSLTSLVLCIRSAGEYLDAISHVLRSSNVPQSWMLIQGVLSAALTMLISARTNFQILDLSLLLVDVPAWSRKCSVCLAVMNERWKDELLTKLETHVEILADETLRFISNGLAVARARGNDQELAAVDTAHVSHSKPTTGQFDHSMERNTVEQDIQASSDIPDAGGTTDWEPLNVFSEFLGADFMDTYWDMQGLGAAFSSSHQNSDAQREDANLFEF